MQFVCTSPAKQVRVDNTWTHPRRHELVVQSGFRELRPPFRDRTVLHLGALPDGQIGALALVTYTTERAVLLRGLAIAQHLRGQGGSHAREAMQVALAAARQERDRNGKPYLVVEGYIHPDNRASKRLCAQFGFAYTLNYTPELELWALKL